MKKHLITITLLVALLTLVAACATPALPSANSVPVLSTNQPTAPGAQLSNSPTKPPNIVFILTDDLDVAEIAYMPKLQTLMVQQGALFNNFFVNVSLCCPSRSTTLRGQYSQNTKIYGNSPPDGGYAMFHSNGDETSTIATWLKDAGYRTMLAGKYLNGYPDSVDKTFIPPGWSEWYSAAKGNAYGEFNYTLNENGKLVDYKNKPEDYGTDVYARKTIDFIQRSAKDNQPFFAYVVPYAPHSPSTPAPRHAQMFANVQAPRTPDFNEADVSDKPDYIKNRPSLSAKQITALDEAYRKRLQSLQAVDEMIGNIIDTLKATGQLDNTYIFFGSDNGFHIGNHRLDTGKVAPYDVDIHVPLVVRGPNVPANVKLDHITGNVDYAPTFAAIAGIKTPDWVDGRSLMPLLRANPPSLDQWRKCYLIQHGDPTKDTIPADDETQRYEVPEDMIGLLEPPDGLPLEVAGDVAAQAIALTPYQGIRTQNYAYIEYRTGEKELYDLRNDPYELNNLASKASPDLLKELATRLHEIEKCSGATCRTIEDKPFPVSTATQPSASLPNPTAAPKPTTQPSLNVIAKSGASYKDVTYCAPDGIAQKMNVFYPKTLSDKTLPVTVYIHGGGWTSGDKGSGAGATDMQTLLARGYLVVSLDYRLAPQYKFPAQITDVKCAIRHLRANAKQYQLDPNRIGVWGGSAGGHLVSMLGTTDKSAGFDVGEYLDQSSRVQAVVDLFGPSDLPAMLTGQALITGQNVFGASSRDDPILVNASPVTFISPDDPPFLILQGDKDKVVPMAQSQELYDKLIAGGGRATLVIVKNAGHGFTPDGGAINPSRAELTKMIADFFDRTLK